MNKENYLINVGQADLERMTMLGDIYGGYNKSFILEQGLKPDMQVADIGCGPGNMSVWFAEQVGKKGRVFAIDQSVEQLTILQQRIQEQELKNIFPKQASIYDLSEFTNQFDLIFCRFIFIHLHRHNLALQQLFNSLKPGGKLIIADMDNQTWESYPPNPSFKKNNALMLKLTKLKRIDFSTGLKLYCLIKKTPFCDITAAVSQPILSGEHRNYFLLRNQTWTGSQFVKNNLISQSEYDQMMEELANMIADENHLLIGARMFQVCGTKKGAD